MTINLLVLQQRNLQRSIRSWLLFFMVALVFSGLTALGVETQLQWVIHCLPAAPAPLDALLRKVYAAVSDTNRRYPFLSYGFDWLVFAHIVIATVFIGPLQDPVRNLWVIRFGCIACCMVIPFALIWGGIRGLPIWWRLIDCSFGLIGLIPLRICLRKILLLEQLQQVTATKKPRLAQAGL